MSIDDSVSKYVLEENIYNKYISEFEQISKSKTETVEKCTKLFESFRSQIEAITPSLTSGAPPSATQIKEVLSFLKRDLHRKTSQLANEIIQSKIDLLYRKNYETFPPSLRLEIAKQCAANGDYLKLTEMIKLYGITDQNEICELVKIRASYDVALLCFNLEDYGITDEQKGLEIAKFITVFDALGGYFVLKFYDKFRISDPINAFELFKIIAQRHPVHASSPALSSTVMKDIKDPQKIYEIACILASKNIKSLTAFIKNQSIVDPDQLFHLAQIGAQAHGARIIKHLDRIGIQDVDQIKVIYRLCYEHAMKQFYLQGDKESLIALSFPDHMQWGFSSTLKMWLDRAIALTVPVDLETEAKKIEWEETFKNLLSDLIKEGIAAGFSEHHLKSLSEKVILKADNPQQQMKYLIWMGDFLMRCGFEPDLKPLLEDKAAAPTFEEIFKLTIPILQVAGTTALTEIYKNEDKRKLWLSFAHEQPEHLLLTSLLLTWVGIQEQTIRKILDSLKAKRYTDYKLMQSINEMIWFLTEKSGL